MTGPELSAALAELGIKRAGLADDCGVDIRTVDRWKADASTKGALPVPRYVETIINQQRKLKKYETIPELGD